MGNFISNLEVISNTKDINELRTKNEELEMDNEALKRLIKSLKNIIQKEGYTIEDLKNKSKNDF